MEYKGVKGVVPALVRVFPAGPQGNEVQDALQPITGRRTVPQVFVGGKFIGGCDGG